MRNSPTLRRLAGSSALFAAVVVSAARADDPSLRGFWRLNERFGSTAVDSSSYHNNGAILNAQPTAAFLDFGLRFSAPDSRVSIPSNTSLNMTDALTISAWINGRLATSLYGYKLVARKGNSYFLGINGSRIYGRVSAGAWRMAAGATFLTDNEWHHIVMTYDRTQDGTPADLSNFNGFRSYAGNPMIVHGAPGEYDQNVREIGNVLYEPDHPDPDMRYRIVYTVWTGTTYQQNITHIAMASSPDGLTWTKRGIIVPQRALEDPYIVKMDGVYYLFAEDKEDIPFRNVRRFHSTDFVNWIDDGDVLDTQPGGNPPYWEGQDVSSIAVYVENGIWYMFYEGRGAGDIHIGLATSVDGLTWTRYSLDPIIMAGADGAWDDHIVCPDDLIKVGDTYYFFYHGSGTATRNLSAAGMMTSTDLIHWTRHPYNPVAWTDGFVALVDPSGLSVFQISGRDIGRWSLARVCAPRLYVDGSEEQYIIRDDSHNLPIVPDANPFSIGNYFQGGPYWFDGIVDEVRLYNRALNSQEVYDLWQDRAGEPIPYEPVLIDDIFNTVQKTLFPP